MGLLSILVAPITGPLAFARWAAATVRDAVDQERRDEDSIKAELMELEMQFELGAVSEDEYVRKQKILFDEMAALRKLQWDDTQ